MRILMVEDDASVAELCRRVLGHQGYDCVLARDAVAARDWIAQRSIDLVLADIVLPGHGSGEDLASEARRRGARALLMSEDHAALRQLAAAGATHLKKPFRVSELLARVHDALGAATEASPPQ